MLLLFDVNLMSSFQRSASVLSTRQTPCPDEAAIQAQQSPHGAFLQGVHDRHVLPVSVPSRTCREHGSMENGSLFSQSSAKSHSSPSNLKLLLPWPHLCHLGLPALNIPPLVTQFPWLLSLLCWQPRRLCPPENLRWGCLHLCSILEPMLPGQNPRKTTSVASWHSSFDFCLNQVWEGESEPCGYLYFKIFKHKPSTFHLFGTWCLHKLPQPNPF